MRNIPNLITGRTAQLPTSWDRHGPATDAVPESDAVPAGAADELVLALPFPPSMNAYWAMTTNAQGQRILIVSQQGRKYARRVQSLVASRYRRPTIDYRIALLIEAWAPSEDYAPGGRWEWDVDNRVKPLQDALAKARVIANDKLIRDVRIVDRGILPPGRVLVRIRRFAGY